MIVAKTCKEIVIMICPRSDALQDPPRYLGDDVDQNHACCRLTACGGNGDSFILGRCPKLCCGRLSAFFPQLRADVVIGITEPKYSMLNFVRDNYDLCVITGPGTPRLKALHIKNRGSAPGHETLTIPSGCKPETG